MGKHQRSGLAWLFVPVIGLAACTVNIVTQSPDEAKTKPAPAVGSGSLTIAGTQLKAAVVAPGARESLSQLLGRGKDGAAANDVVIVDFAGGQPTLATKGETSALDVLFVKNNRIVSAYSAPACTGFATKDIPVYQASDIPLYTAKPIPVYTAQPVTPVSAAPVPVYTAQPLVSVSACSDIEPVEADAALVFTAGTIAAKDYKVGTSISLQLGGASGAHPAPATNGQFDPRIVGKWAIAIPNFVWPVDKQIFKVDGATLGLVTINADGSYVWHKKWGDFPGKLQAYVPQRPPAAGQTYFKLNDGKYDFYFTGDLTTLYSPAADLYAASGAYLGQ